MTQKIRTILIFIAIFLLIYGRDFAHIFYDARNTELIGVAKKEMIRSYWNMRFGIYSLIILISFTTAKQQLTRFQIMLVNIGIEFASWSAFDKIILNEYGQSEYDKLIIFLIILFEVWKYRKKIKNENRTIKS